MTRTGRLPLAVLPLALTYLAVALNMTIASVALLAATKARARVVS